ncbi:MAG: hypothetical protein ACTHOO_06760 [Alcanivorax sp.]
MLMKVGRIGQINRLLAEVEAIGFIPSMLTPLLLVDGNTDAAPSLWQSESLEWPGFYQAVSASQSALNSGAFEFDGSDDYMLGAYYSNGARAAQILPDGAGSETGKGITCTGLAKDDAADSFWIANHGQATGSHPYTPSLMNVTKDGATEISEIELIPLFPAMQSVQGLAVDTSDSTLWFVSTAESLVRHITKAGASIGSFSVDSGANGLAYDSNDDSLLVLYSNRQIKRYSASTGVLIETVTTLSTLSNVDHLYLDTVKNIVWVSHGSSAKPGRVSAYSIDDDVLSDPVRLPESDAIEGIYLDGEALYVVSDGYFHNGTLNKMHTYDFSSLPIENAVTRRYSALEFNMVFKIGAVTSATEAVISLGDPLSGMGFGLFLVGSTDNTIRVVIDDGSAALDAVDIVCDTALTSYSVITIKADFTNRTISLYQNGTYQGQGSYDASIQNDIAYCPMSLGALPDGSRAVHLDIKDICITDYLLSASQGNNLGNYYADEHGLIWTDI